MIRQENKRTILLLLSAAGLGIAVLSALEGRLSWVDAFCGVFGNGCRETAAFRMLKLPVWFWGVAYYAALTGAVLYVRTAVFWLVVFGLGVEISLAWVMISRQVLCVFCLFNAVVVVLLAWACFEKNRLWQALAAGLLAFSASSAIFSETFPAQAEAVREKQRSAAVAQVGDEIITQLDLESPLSSQIYKLQRDIYQLKRNHLEELIDQALLRKEAGEKKMSVQQLVDSILSNPTAVSDTEVDAYFNENQLRFGGWNGTQEELKARIRAHLQGQKARSLVKAYLEPLRSRFPVTIHLAEPPLPFSKVSLGNSPFQGPDDAPVTIVEFSDYLCPACRKAHETSKKMKEMYAGKVKWVFKDFPLDMHEGAREMAEAAQCAGEQGRFWEFQDRLFSSPGKPDAAALDNYAQQLGMDVPNFRSCLESRKFHGRIEEDINQARQSGVNATPTFIINGRLRPGSPSPEDFKRLIDEELERTSAFAAAK